MAENTYDAHVHFGEPSSQQPYDKSTIYVNELNQLFDELALRERWFFPNPNVSDKREEMNDYIAQRVQKHTNRLMDFSRTYRGREKTLSRNQCAMKKKFNATELRPNLMVEYFRPDISFFTRFFQKRAIPSLSSSFNTDHGFSSFKLIKTTAKKPQKLPIIWVN